MLPLPFGLTVHFSFVFLPSLWKPPRLSPHQPLSCPQTKRRPPRPTASCHPLSHPHVQMNTERMENICKKQKSWKREFDSLWLLAEFSDLLLQAAPQGWLRPGFTRHGKTRSRWDPPGFTFGPVLPLPLFWPRNHPCFQHEPTSNKTGQRQSSPEILQ